MLAALKIYIDIQHFLDYEGVLYVRLRGRIFIAIR